MGFNEELRALGHVVDRLVDKYPDVPREEIEEIVQQEHHSLDEGRVRDYVPILVEPAAKDRLNH
ncbi:three-helix bundle dimerization domain-containing protein [Pseudarthrobacter sp. NPDC080039]|uniref:three-helix bundle dimerization domain-containing protein n=1 Tax=unclassified Pseudarthrobacter TaxID=2647000 RepID=UPI00344B59E6